MDDTSSERAHDALTPVIVGKTDPQDAPALAELMAQAFGADPWVQAHARPDGELTERLREHYLLLLSEHWLPSEIVDVAEASTPAGPIALGVAVWEGPDSAGEPEELALRAGQILGLDPQIEQADQRRVLGLHPPQRHWRLAMLTVSPSAQGQRVGSSLLEHGLERAESLPIALEATTPGSRRLYERWGFRLVELVTDAAGVRQAVMLREPGTG